MVAQRALQPATGPGPNFAILTGGWGRGTEGQAASQPGSQLASQPVGGIGISGWKMSNCAPC